MLRELLRRDLLLHGRHLLIVYAIFLAFQIYFVRQVSSARAWLVLGSVYAAFLAITIFAREDKFRSTAWTCTLPVSRREVVRARFTGAWLTVLAAMVAGTLLAAILPGSRVAVSELIDAPTMLLAAWTITLVLALMLPFLIRFGLAGLLIFLVGGQLLGALVLVLAVITRRRGGGPLRLGIGTVRDGVVALYDALPAPLFYLLATALLVAINWAGYRLALFLFRRREL